MYSAKMKSYTLLYAEDDDDIREGYATLLEHLFKCVYLASDGKEALELYKVHSPHILLLDINMPYIDGLTLVEKIRKYDKDVKIIILTAHLEEEKLLRAISLNLIRYLKKPVKRRELEDVLDEAVSELEEERDSNVIKLSQEANYNTKLNILTHNNEEIHLTKNEIIIMNIFTSQCKEYYSINDLIELYWLDYSKENISEESIRNIIKRLKYKLPQNLIINNHGIGYKLLFTK